MQISKGLIFTSEVAAIMACNQSANKIWYYREFYLVIKNKIVIYRNMSGTADHRVKRNKPASVNSVYSRVESKLMWLSALMDTCGMRIRGGALGKRTGTSKRAMGVKQSKHMMYIILYYEHLLPEIPLA